VNQDLNSFTENQIKAQISNLPPVLSEEQKQLLYKLLSQEFPKYLQNEDLTAAPLNTQQVIVKNALKWVIIETVKLFKSPIPQEHYSFTIGEIIDTMIKVLLTGIEARFDKEEFSKIIKEEAHVALEFCISLLRDEDKIDQTIYERSMQLINQ
jgi:hypothetical protein